MGPDQSLLSEPYCSQTPQPTLIRAHSRTFHSWEAWSLECLDRKVSWLAPLHPNHTSQRSQSTVQGWSHFLTGVYLRMFIPTDNDDPSLHLCCFDFFSHNLSNVRTSYWKPRAQLLIRYGNPFPAHRVVKFNIEEEWPFQLQSLKEKYVMSDPDMYHIYVCVYTYIHTYIHIYIYIYIVCVCVCVCVCIS